MSLKGVLANGLLLMVSLTLTLAAAELWLRFGMSPERLVPNAPETPALNERRNSLRFFARHRDQLSFSSHDRWLGWDAGHPSTRVRGRSSIDPPPATGMRVITLGDSFTWGNEVEADENFAHLLEAADGNLQVLNMGVPGYGIDQMVLKYERHGAALAPDLIILGIYVSDYERSTVAFTAAAKPLFQVVGNELRLSNSPVPAPAVAVESVRRSLSGQPLLREFVVNRLPGARQAEAAFFDATDLLIASLIRRLEDNLTDRQRLLVLHIPRGEAFVETDAFHEEMARRLLGIYDRLGLPVVNLEAVLASHSPWAEIPARFYRINERGSIGHLNPAGHRLAATALAEAIRALPESAAVEQPLAFARQNSMIPTAR